MGHPAHAVKFEVVRCGMATQHAASLPAQLLHRSEMARKTVDGLPGQIQQLTHQDVTLDIRFGRATPLHLGQTVLQCVHQHLSPARVVQQVVFQVGVALHHPDVTQDFVEHARRPPGTTFFTQLTQQLPAPCAQQASHDFTVGKRGVVVRNLTQPWSRLFRCGRTRERMREDGGVHRRLSNP